MPTPDGDQFKQLQLFDDATYVVPAANQQSKPPPKNTPRSGVHREALEAVDRAPSSFKYKGPPLYHGTSAPLGKGDVVLPLGRDVGTGGDMLHPLGKAVRAAYATPDYEDASRYARYSIPEGGHTVTKQDPRLFHDVLRVKPLGKVGVRTHGFVDADATEGTEEVLSAHGYAVEGVAGYVANAEAVEKQPTESSSDYLKKLQLTPTPSDIATPQPTRSGGKTWRHHFGKQDIGTSVLVKEEEARNSAHRQYSQKYDSVVDRLEKNPRYRAKPEFYAKMDELSRKLGDANVKDGDSYRDLHGDD
jgi:hypothetical protein